jgi:hypothetical protein
MLPTDLVKRETNNLSEIDCLQYISSVSEKIFNYYSSQLSASKNNIFYKQKLALHYKLIVI